MPPCTCSSTYPSSTPCAGSGHCSSSTRPRVPAALAGVAISAVAIASLVVSYGRGLLGWHEAGFRTPVAWAMVTELGAVILLSSALAGVAFAHGSRTRLRGMPAEDSALRV